MAGVAGLGATGMVGQRLVAMLRDHPLFELKALCASDRSAGRTYAEAAPWRLEGEDADWVADWRVRECRPEALPDDVDIVLSALPTNEAKAMEPVFAEAGLVVVSNAGAYRSRSPRAADHPRDQPRPPRDDRHPALGRGADHQPQLLRRAKRRKWDQLLGMAEALSAFMGERGFWNDALWLYSAALDGVEKRLVRIFQPPLPLDWNRKISLLTKLGSISLQQGYFQEAEQYLVHAMQTAELIQNKNFQAQISNILASLSRLQGTTREITGIRTSKQASSP